MAFLKISHSLCPLQSEEESIEETTPSLEPREKLVENGRTVLQAKGFSELAQVTDRMSDDLLEVSWESTAPIATPTTLGRGLVDNRQLRGLTAEARSTEERPSCQTSRGHVVGCHSLVARCVPLVPSPVQCLSLPNPQTTEDGNFTLLTERTVWRKKQWILTCELRGYPDNCTCLSVSVWKCWREAVCR